MTPKEIVLAYASNAVCKKVKGDWVVTIAGREMGRAWTAQDAWFKASRTIRKELGEEKWIDLIRG